MSSKAPINFLTRSNLEWIDTTCFGRVEKEFGSAWFLSRLRLFCLESVLQRKHGGEIPVRNPKSRSFNWNLGLQSAQRMKSSRQVRSGSRRKWDFYATATTRSARTATVISREAVRANFNIVFAPWRRAVAARLNLTSILSARPPPYCLRM